MGNQKSLASLLIFVGSALCFLFPFVTVSCGGIRALSLTGQQLATGTTLTEPQPFGAPQTQKVDADPFAALAGFCAIGGVALSLIGRRLAGATAASAGVGAVSLLVMRFRLDDQLQKQTGGMASVTYETGFTLATLLLITGVALNAYLFRQNQRSSGAVPGTPDKIGDFEDRSAFQSPYASTVPKAETSPITASDSNIQSPSLIGQGMLGSQHCSRCGQMIGPTAHFCEACGTPAGTSIGANENKAFS